MNLAGLIVLSLALGLAAWLFFMWTVRSGQYEDPEGAKYRMLEEDEGVPPERRPAEGGASRAGVSAARDPLSPTGGEGTGSERDARGERGP